MPADAPWPANLGRIILESVDSTNAEAARQSLSYSGPVWIMARRQTAGRGRRGRPWRDPGGNFAATLLTRPEGTPLQAAQRSFVAALALHEALAGLIGTAAPLALKWPNDVLLDGGKLAGILLEGCGGAPGPRCLAIGIGVNLHSAPPPEDAEGPGLAPGLAQPAPVSLMGVLGRSFSPEVLLDRLAPAYDAWEARLGRYGFDPLREAWLARAARLGRPLTARVGGDTYSGTFETLDASGALVLALPEGGRRVIPAADVYFT